MRDRDKTKEQLIEELAQLRTRVETDEASGEASDEASGNGGAWEAASEEPAEGEQSLASLALAAEESPSAPGFGHDVAAVAGARSPGDERILRLVNERQHAVEQLRRQYDFTRAITSSLGEGLCALDTEGTVTFANPAAESMLGRTEAEMLGRPLHALIFPRQDESERPDGDCALLEPLRTGLLAGSNETAFTRRDGSVLPVAFISAPIESGGQVIGVVVSFHDITARLQANELRSRAAKQAALRADISLALAGSGTLDSALQRCIEALVKHLDVALARIWTLDEANGVLDLRASAGLSTSLDGTDRHVALGQLTIGGIAWRREPYLTNDVRGDARIDDDDRDWARREGMVAFAGYPLLVGDAVVGVMAIFARHVLSGDTLDVLGSSADVIAQGIVRRRGDEERRLLLKRERAARRAAEEAQHRLQFLAEASILLASSLDYAATLSQVVQLAVPRIADWCYVDVVAEDGSLQRLDVAHVDPTAREALLDLRHRYSPPPDHPVSRVLRTGEAEFAESTPDELLALAAPDSQVLEALRSLRMRSYMALPIHGRERVLGVLMCMTTTSDRRYTPEDLRVGEELARRAALAIENSRLYQRMETVLRQVEDIARREQAQAAELSAVIEAMPDGVFACDTNGMVTRANAKGAAMLGLEMEQTLASSDGYSEMIHMSYPDGRLVPPGEYSRFKALRGETVSDRYIIRRYDTGEERQILDSAAPIRDGDGTITGAVVVISDVTELYRLERQKDEFLSIASHELKTPLTTLKILTQLTHKRLVKAGALEAEQTQRMERAIGRMERLVNDLLDVSRIDSGKLALRKERFDLVALCRQVAEEQMAAADRPIALELPSGPIGVDADSDRVGQVLTNLLSNALKYSAQRDGVRLRLVYAGGAVTTSVFDAGAGIPPDALPHLFERFYRVPGVQVQSGSGVGLGLGLFISKEIIERHGGRLWAESIVGEGSTFSFTLPPARH